MKGLILGDYYCTKRNIRFVIVISVIISAIMLLVHYVADTMTDMEFMSVLFMIYFFHIPMALAISMSSLLMDETCSRVKTALSAPVTRREYYRGKLLYHVICSVGLQVLAALECLIILIITGRVSGFALIFWLVSPIVCMLLSLLPEAWALSVGLRFGVNKVFNVFICIGVFYFGVYELFKALNMVAAAAFWIVFGAVTLALIIATICMFFVGLEWFEKKEI